MSTEHQLAEEIAGGCLAARSRRLARVVSRAYEEALRPHGLTPAQMSVLVAAELTGPAPVGELGDALDLDKSTMSRNARLMVQRGWLEADESGRQVLIRITASGRGTLRSAYTAWERAQHDALARLGADAPARLDDLLQHADA